MNTSDFDEFNLDDIDEIEEWPRFVLVDGHGLIYRAYHAFPGLTSPDGMLINAVFGFSRILLQAIRDLDPLYIAVAFDHKAPTKRSETFEDYKAHRPSMPDDLKPQIAIIKEVVDALNIPRFELAGYEADDLIGTIAAKQTQYNEALSTGETGTPDDRVLTTIVTSDKDLLQLVNTYTHVWMPSRGKKEGDIEYDQEVVLRKMGILPQQVKDYKALMGDPSDNIPGVKGVGKKTAGALIQEFGSLDAVYEAVEKVAAGESLVPETVLKGAVFKKLQTGREQAYLSLELATIDQDVPIDFELDKCLVTKYDKPTVVDLFEKLNFKSLLKLLPNDEFESAVQDALF